MSSEVVIVDDIYARVRSGSQQQRPAAAVLLSAVEATITDQGEQLQPLAYFGALMTLLKQQSQNEDPDAVQDIVVAVAHLLSIVIVRVQTNVLRIKFNEVAAVFGTVLQAHHSCGPAVRDLISCIEALLLAQDLAAWSIMSNKAQPLKSSELRSLFLILLILAIDERPKIRKRSHDALKRLLSRPPAPSIHHPATIPVIEYCLNHIIDFSSSQTAKETQILHVLVLLKSMLPVLALQGGHEKTRDKLKVLCDELLKLPVKSSGTGNTVMTQWVFGVLESLFGAPSRSSPDGPFPHLDIVLIDSVLRTLLTIRPYQNDVTLGPAWLNLIGKGFLGLSKLVERAEQNATAAGDEMAVASDVNVAEYASSIYPELMRVFWADSFGNMLSGEKRVVVERAGSLFSELLKTCILDSMVETALRERSKKGPIVEILESVESALGNVLFRDAWGVILSVCEAALDRLGGDAPLLVTPILNVLVSIRDEPKYGEEYPFKAELESCLEAAALAMGFERFTSIAPLNILDAAEQDIRRPYILSVFVKALESSRFSQSRASNGAFGPSNLSFFASELMPLSRKIDSRALDLRQKGHAHSAKLFETLNQQIFSLFPAICRTVPGDLHECFNSLAPQLGKILQQGPPTASGDEAALDVRPCICTGLQSLIESYNAIVDDDAEDSIDETVAETANAGLSLIRRSANKFLSTLCNTYTTVDPSTLELGNDRTSVLQHLHQRGNHVFEGCINAFLTIADGNSVNSYFFGLVKTLLQYQTSPPKTGGEGDDTEMALIRLRMYSVIDLISVLLPHLPDVARLQSLEEDEESVKEIPADSPLHLLYKVVSGQLRDSDTTLQKKTYKVLNLLMDTIPSSQLPLQDLMSKLIDPEVISLASSGVKRQRVRLLQRIVEVIPDDEEAEAMLLEFVPVALSEVMLTTKEASEKARVAAYECLVGMGRRMLAAGIKNERERAGEDMDDDSSAPTASIKEYCMMVVAGLAGESSHMQSASIASLARLIFEFQDSLSEDLQKELIATVLMFMSSANREIVKAALGFIKVVIVAVPQEYLEEHLETIITNILAHSRDHKSHFKAKVRHIFERLIRRFSLEAVEGFVPESDSRLIANIRKRKERLRKKKATERSKADNDGSDDEVADPKIAALRQKKMMQSRQREFEDAIGSDSELDSDDSGADDDSFIPERFRSDTAKGKAKGAGLMIREGDNVVDFLDSQVVSRITSASRSSSKKTTRSSKGADFAIDEDGRMVVDDEDENGGAQAEADEDMAAAASQGVEDLYLESIKGEGAFKRLPDGRIKFVNKRKRDGDDFDDGDDGEVAPNAGQGWSKFGLKKKTSAATLEAQKAQREKMLGAQYKAKRAKGDVKRAGMPDPHAYIPLSGRIVGNKTKSTKLSSEFLDLVKATRTGGDVKGKKLAKTGPVASRSRQNKRQK